MDRVILLADKNSNAWFFAEKIQQYLREAKEVEIPLEEVEISFFKNGEINMHVPENLRRKEVYFIQDSTKNPQQWWVELLLLKDLLLSASVDKVGFVLPELLFSRQDRKDRPHVPISARAVAESLAPDLDRIITMDIHTDQIQGFYPPKCCVDCLHSFPNAVAYLQEHPDGIENLERLAIVSPDAGGVDRARAFAQRLSSVYPVSFIEKRRSYDDKKIEEMRFVGDVDNKDAFIVDDMIDTGRTQLKAEKLLKEHGAKKLFCYGTHGHFLEGTGELMKKFERIMTSNTHYKQTEGVEVVDVSGVFAEAIYRAQKGLSISKLFE